MLVITFASETSIDNRRFREMKDLVSITLPETLTSICESAFSFCTNLASITFNGTVEQWNAISKGENWSEGILATEVVCSNGTVTLN